METILTLGIIAAFGYFVYHKYFKVKPKSGSNGETFKPEQPKNKEK
jgi:hypothetical protein